MKKKVFIGFLLLMMMVCYLNAFPQLKKRVAVFTFEDKSEHGWHWWDGKGPGEGMADMLTTELVKSGKYRVIERQEIDQLMQEQNLGQTGRVTEQSAAQIGKLLGVELAVIGAVTEFGYSKSDKGGRIKGVGLGVSKKEATVAIDVRFVNTETGEILAAENVRKHKSKGGISISTPEFGYSDRNSFDNSLVGKATREAVEEMVELIDKQMQSIPWQGKILKVSGSTVYIKPGSDGGVQVGDIFTVYSEGEALIDPDTGLNLGSAETEVGTIEVTGLIAGGKAATAVIRSGTGFKIGDLVKQQ
jgi:curli biogenesis system outer membrane secretion channel CsgG